MPIGNNVSRMGEVQGIKSIIKDYARTTKQLDFV